MYINNVCLTVHHILGKQLLLLPIAINHNILHMCICLHTHIYIYIYYIYMRIDRLVSDLFSF